jgi:hypothetical protein
MKPVKCKIEFFYDPVTYLYDWENTRPSEEEIFRRCKEMMIEDLTDYSNPIDSGIIQAEFIEVDDGD